MDRRQSTIVVAIIKNENGELLLSRRHQPDIPEIHDKWEFIGGGLDFGETPEQAIKREAREEAGVEIEVGELLPRVVSNVQSFGGGELHVIILSYVCKIISGELKANKDEEIAELKFVPLNEVKNYPAFENVYEIANLLNKN